MFVEKGDAMRESRKLGMREVERRLLEGELTQVVSAISAVLLERECLCARDESVCEESAWREMMGGKGGIEANQARGEDPQIRLANTKNYTYTNSLGGYQTATRLGERADTETTIRVAWLLSGFERLAPSTTTSK